VKEVVDHLSPGAAIPAATHLPDPKAPIPKQIRYIIGNEGCERFSFYGMRNILTVFLVSSLLLYLPEGERERSAKDVFHTFVIGVYFFPLLGGWLADRFYGKYNTIFWLSLVYCAGQACLAALYRQGAEFIAADPLTKSIVAEIRQGPLPAHEHPKGEGFE
jgi:POT family proton-dependent oligopeptide transporter